MSLPNKAYFVTVTEYSGAGQRIDNFLVKELKNIPNTYDNIIY